MVNNNKWKRPENVPFPSVWRTFERKETDGAIKKYWVQDLVPEYEDIFLKNYEDVYLKEEALYKYSKISEDPQAIEHKKNLYRSCMNNRMVLICLTEDANGHEELVGGNIFLVLQKSDEGNNRENITPAEEICISIIQYVRKCKNVYEELNVEEYLTGCGLYIMPKFRGRGIGREILKARREFGLATNLKCEATIFTCIQSQKNAEKAGFVNIVEIKYEDFEKINPLWNLSGITPYAKTLKYMYLKYE
ncbi:hypothetical protein NQ315_008180 [Exocentrus adspersus]|uniref:N-acetyltransferase domain-containing protein n=1 Tax=Exocentrus adspersus TaxID=1586481 RepID=A0AAV8VW52_9CUCU|nr:hypothetical protein NQ315_008180 [Exocentrus adspersus]